jgi:hypothetical protein
MNGVVDSYRSILSQDYLDAVRPLIACRTEAYVWYSWGFLGRNGQHNGACVPSKRRTSQPAEVAPSPVATMCVTPAR